MLQRFPFSIVVFSNFLLYLDSSDLGVFFAPVKGVVAKFIFTRMISLFWRNYFTRNYILIVKFTQDTYLSNFGEVEKFAAGKKYYYSCFNTNELG